MWNATVALMHAKVKLRVGSSIIIDENTMRSDIGNVRCCWTKKMLQGWDDMALRQ
jgi:hypothetical protein